MPLTRHVSPYHSCVLYGLIAYPCHLCLSVIYPYISRGYGVTEAVTEW